MKKVLSQYNYQISYFAVYSISFPSHSSVVVILKHFSLCYDNYKQLQYTYIISGSPDWVEASAPVILHTCSQYRCKPLKRKRTWCKLIEVSEEVLERLITAQTVAVYNSLQYRKLLSYKLVYNGFTNSKFTQVVLVV